MKLPGLFVTGTDTGVGKTRITAAIAHTLTRNGRRVGVLKPIATGATPADDGRPFIEDAELLAAAIGGGVPIDRVTPLVFEEPLAPCVAARRAGTPLRHEAIRVAVAEAQAWWSSRADCLLVEGVGGLLCPLADDSTVADLAKDLDYPLLIVARRGLGTLNHTLLTIEAAEIRGLRIAGVILNGSEPTTSPIAEATNPDELARRLGPVPLLADWPHGDDLNALAATTPGVDWYSRFATPR